MLYLALTLGTTASAPLADRLLRAHPRTEALIDALLQVWIAGILLLHAIPHALHEAGPWALAALIAGGLIGIASHRGERTLVGLALVGLLLHGLTDGAALATDAHLSVAVVLHTLPVALAVWRISAVRSRSVGLGALLLTAIATLAGFFATDYALAGGEGTLFAVMECLLAGILLHVIGHLSPARDTRASGIGAVAGGAIAITQARPWEDPSFSLVLDAAPALVLGYLAAGLLHAAAPASLARWLTGRSTLGSSLRGALVGTIVPVCSCGALPVYRGLLSRGVSAKAALPFLVAGPEVGIGTLLVSLPLLGAPLTAARLLAAIAAALCVGLLLGGKIQSGADRPSAQPQGPLRERLREGLRFGLVETVDHTAAWVIAGLAVASWVEPVFASGALSEIPGPIQVVTLALVGVPAYVCASGATPLAAALIGLGVTPGAAVAFLLTGPATNIATFGILRRMHGTRLALGFGIVVAAVAVSAGLAIDLLWPDIPPLSPGEGHAHGAVEWASVLLLAALFGAALLRGGPQGFVDPLIHPLHDHGDGDIPHVHGPGCGHVHHGGALAAPGVPGAPAFQVKLDLGRPKRSPDAT